MILTSLSINNFTFCNLTLGQRPVSVSPTFENCHKETAGTIRSMKNETFFPYFTLNQNSNSFSVFILTFVWKNYRRFTQNLSLSCKKTLYAVSQFTFFNIFLHQQDSFLSRESKICINQRKSLLKLKIVLKKLSLVQYV